MKKTLTTLITASLIVAAFFAIPGTKGFSDINANTDYKSAIDWMTNNGVIQGYADQTFKPDQCVKRVEFLKMLFLMLNIDANNSTAELFKDTYADQWYAPYVKTARARGTVEGYPDGTFKPAQCVARVEALKMAILEFNETELPEPLTEEQTLPTDVYTLRGITTIFYMRIQQTSSEETTWYM